MLDLENGSGDSCAFKAATDGKQVAILVPTTILAFQHYRSFKERLKIFR
jgi:transcription-repair coupling factor (superfamily II helicase)